jgi:threonine dehydrogenase-like Zn-dependent dehydrogenase
VLNTLREQGLVPTLRKVKERLKAPTSLGYSCAGTVVAVGPEVDEFHVSERVACIGEGVATHAEYNAVPRNLVVRVPAGVSLDAASAISSISPSFSRAACRSRSRPSPPRIPRARRRAGPSQCASPTAVSG